MKKVLIVLFGFFILLGCERPSAPASFIAKGNSIDDACTKYADSQLGKTEDGAGKAECTLGEVLIGHRRMNAQVELIVKLKDGGYTQVLNLEKHGEFWYVVETFDGKTLPSDSGDE